jgi:RecA-family ATPase
MRCPGGTNTKNGDNIPVEMWGGDDDTKYDINDLIETWSKTPPVLTVARPTSGNGADAAAEERAGPIDVDACLAAMRFGSASNGIHVTQRSVSCSLLRQGLSTELVLERLLEATRKAVAGDPRAAAWRWNEERVKVGEMIADWITKNPELADRLPDKVHKLFERKRAEGWVAEIGFSAGGEFYVRTKERATAPKTDAPEAPLRVILRPFVPIDPATLPRRQFLYGKHFQRRVVSATIAPGGTGKTSLGNVEAVAMATGRNLLGEQPEERCKVWIHNGEDGRDELLRRIVAICQHHDIPQEELVGWLFLTSGTEMPLKIANGYGDLKMDHALIEELTRTILANEIDLVMLDPLVTLHGVNESDNAKMDAVIRVFTKIADTCDCSIDICHHTRKLSAAAVAAGTDLGVDDGRGASAVRDAVRQLRILNLMSLADAERLGIGELERLGYLRVDRGKSNTTKPANAATWRKFESVHLANDDDVGVVVAWDCPGHDTATPQQAAADRQAEVVFLQLLDRFLARGVNVSASGGPNYAPAKFVTEREARLAKVGKTALKDAMTRLLDAGRIRTELTGRGAAHRLVPWQESPT